jgi:hypothetical protein
MSNAFLDGYGLCGYVEDMCEHFNECSHYCDCSDFIKEMNDIRQIVSQLPNMIFCAMKKIFGNH